MDITPVGMSSALSVAMRSIRDNYARYGQAAEAIDCLVHRQHRAPQIIVGSHENIQQPGHWQSGQCLFGP